MTNSERKTIYLISDGTGETASTMVRAALVQYSLPEMNIVRNKNIRTEQQVEAVVEEAAQNQAFIAYTVVNEPMRKKIAALARDKKLAAVDLLGPLLNGLDEFFGVQQKATEAGKLRSVNEQYFRRIEAIEFAVKTDDGKDLKRLKEAHLILVGISRTSKTPLSIFLSHKGWKVANVPLVYNVPLPEELFMVEQRKIVGLVIDPDTLLNIRKNRLERFGQDPGAEYASLGHIQRELDYALDIFRQNKRWPVFNVTDRALEETASEITRIIAARMNYQNIVTI